MKRLILNFVIITSFAMLIYASTTPPSGAVIEEHESMESSSRVGDSGGQETRHAQQFYLEGTGGIDINGIGILLKSSDYGDPVGDITLEIYTTSSSKPGALVSNSSMAFTPVLGSWNYVTFTSTVTLSAGSDHKYWIVASMAAQDSNNAHYWCRSNGNTYAKGYHKCEKSNDPGVWVTESNDLSFRVYADASLSVSGVQSTLRACDEGVEVSWQTRTEIGTLGYHVYRGVALGGPFQRLTSRMMPSEGSPSMGGRYQFLDASLEQAGTYYYRITEVHGQGETEIVAPMLIRVEAESVCPETCHLQGAFPNPFNPGTRLRYQLSQEGQGQSVRLAVYDMLGRCVAVLTDRMGEKGAFDIDWDGCNSDGVQAPSGVYFGRLDVGGEIRGCVKLMKIK